MNGDTLDKPKPLNVGRAYVTFQKPIAAERCVERFANLDGRSLRVSMAAPEASRTRKSAGGMGAMSRYWIKDISTKCFRCGEVGHMEASCPNAALLKPCPLCGKTDHDMRDCSMTKICFRCGFPGHINRQCKMRQSVPTRLVCGVCLQSGHHRIACRRSPLDAPSQDVICMTCGRTGHYLCSEMRWFFGIEGMHCFNCGQKGHSGYQCDRPNINQCSGDDALTKGEIERAKATEL